MDCRVIPLEDGEMKAVSNLETGMVAAALPAELNLVSFYTI